MGKCFALLLVFAFLTASCLIVDKPVSGASATVENSWVAKAPIHEARANLGVAVVDGDIYAIGGDNVNGLYNQDQGFYSGISGGTLNANELYNPSTDTWSVGPQCLRLGISLR